MLSQNNGRQGRERLATVDDLLLNLIVGDVDDRQRYVVTGDAARVRGADPVPWMYAIAHRTFLDEMRRRKRARVRVARDPDTMPEQPADLEESGRLAHQREPPSTRVSLTGPVEVRGRARRCCSTRL